MTPLFHGIILNLSLLISPGVQNMFILEQSMLYRRIFITCGISALCDLILIAVGVFGFGLQFSGNQFIINLLVCCGVITLICHGIRTMKVACFPQPHHTVLGNTSSREAVATTLSFSLLNPSVYLDTIGIVGMAGALYPSPSNFQFWLGASLCSITWFFSVGFLGSRLSNVFKNMKTKRRVQKIVCVLMIVNALILIRRLKNVY